MLGVEVGIDAAEPVGEGYGLASENTRVELVGGPVEAVVVKRWDLDGRAGSTEIRFYEDLADRVGINLPVALASGVDGSTGWLVLEALDGFRQGDVLVEEDDSAVEAIVGMLARMHGRWWGSPELPRLDWLRDAWATVPGIAWCDERRSAYIERFGRPVNDIIAALVERAPAVFEHGATVLRRFPATLVHGDVHLDNVLFSPTGRPYLLDWAGCRRGPGSQDLAAVLFGMGSADTHNRLLDVYHSALRDHGVDDVSRLELIEMCGAALHWMAMFWTLGLARWVPDSPRETAMQDEHMRRIARAVDQWRLIDPSVFDEVLG